MTNKTKDTIYFSVPTKGVNSLFFHPSKEKLLVASRSGGLLMYQIGTENRPFCFSAPNFSPIRGIVIPNSDRTVRVVGASFEGKVALWEEHSEKPVSYCQGHSAPINDMDVLLYSGHFMTAGNDKVIKIWDPNLKFITSFTEHKSQVTCCAFDQTNKFAISGDQSGLVLLWDYTKPELGPIWDFNFQKSKKYPITSVDIDSTGQCFSILTSRGHLGIFDLRNPENVVSQPFKAMPNMQQLHPSKPYVLCTGSQNNEMIYSAASNSLLFSFEGHKAPIKCCAWSPNGKKIASADEDGTVIIWNVPKPPKVPRVTNMYKWDVTEQSTIPSISAVMPFEVLAEELNILTEHVDEYNEKLINQEKRMQQLVEDYRWRV